MRGDHRVTEGSVSITTLFSIGIILTLALGLLFLLSSIRNYSIRLKNKDTIRSEAIALLYEIQESIAVLKEDEADSPLSDGVRTLEHIYSEYNLQIQDVSSGINLQFMNDAFLSDETINNLITSDPDHTLVEYGWAHKNTIDEEMKSRIQESFSIQDDEKLFPLINEFPMTNIHYLSEDCLAAFLKYYKIADAEKKASQLHERSQTALITNLREILAVKDDHRIFDLLGYKTSFWKVTFVYTSCIVEAIFCAVPDVKEPREIDHYTLIERNIRL